MEKINYRVLNILI